MYGSDPYTQGRMSGPTTYNQGQHATMIHVHNVMKNNETNDRTRYAVPTKSVVPPVIACIVIQAVASFYYITTTLTFAAVVDNARDFSDNRSQDLYNIYIVFNVFFAIAAAMCGPMIKNSGYHSTILGGCILFIFSTMSSSLVSTAEILIIPYSVFGACSYALLKVGPAVAMLDYLNDRRSLATALSYLGITVGQIAGVLSYIFTDMVDDASYSGSGKQKWPNNLRIIEVTVVVALMATAFLRKPSFTTGSFPELFKYKPFYLLLLIQFLSNVGFGLQTEILSETPDKRNFESKYDGTAILTPTFIGYLAQIAGVILTLIFIKTCCASNCKKAALLFGSVGLICLAAGGFVHEETYFTFWPFAGYAMGDGVAQALLRITLPLAMIQFVGRCNNKLALPFLELSGGLGTLIGTVILAERDSEDLTFNILWYVIPGIFALAALLGFITQKACPDWEQHLAGDDELEANRVHVIENAAFEPDAQDLS